MKKTTLAIFFFACIVLISCASEHGSGIMHLYVHSDEYEKTLHIDDSISDVTRFSVTGYGPGGKTFTVDSTSSSIIIEGLPLGEWRVEASGFNTKGKLIASGNIEFNLTSNKTPQTVRLNKINGVGSLQLRYEWNDNVENPSIELEIYNEDFKQLYMSKIIRMSGATSYTTVNFSGLTSGCYLVISRLSNTDVVVAGTAETIKIEKGEKTTGTISFAEEEAASEYRELYVPYIKGSPLTGHIAGLSSVNPTKDLELELVLDKQYNGESDFLLQWYLDGYLLEENELLPAGNTVTVNSNSGFHIINAVVLSKEKSVCGSATEKFRTKVSGKPGVALPDGKIIPSENTNLLIDDSSFYGLLPGNKCVVVTKSRGVMQLFSIKNSQPVVEQTLRGSDSGTEWLYDSTALFSDRDMNLFLINDSNKNMDFMYYNPATCKIENAYIGDTLLRLEGSTEIPSHCEFNGTRYVMFYPDSEDGGGVLAAIDSKCSKGFQVNSSGNGPYSRAVLDINAYAGPRIMKATDDKIVLTGSSSTLYCAMFNGHQRTSKWYETQLSVSKVQDFIFLDRTNILLTDGNRIVHYRYNLSSLQWICISSFESDAVKLVKGNNPAYFYVLDSKNRILTYSNNYYSFNCINVSELDSKVKDVLITADNHLICPCNDGCIQIMTIIDD